MLLSFGRLVPSVAGPGPGPGPPPSFPLVAFFSPLPRANAPSSVIVFPLLPGQASLDVAYGMVRDKPHCVDCFKILAPGTASKLPMCVSPPAARPCALSYPPCAES